jgi:sugar (pentulose or hexulose) kinase
MGTTKKYVAFDIGASNGRCMLGKFDGDKLRLETINRFGNCYIRVHDHLYWDVLQLFENIKESLRIASRITNDRVSSIAVDTWGVDFGLLDENGNLIGNPYCYRDPHTTGMMEEVFKVIPQWEVFKTTGVQFMTVNTLYQLMSIHRAKSPALIIAKTFLMIPDLINYWLTGRKVCEYTNASTTQFLDATSKNWAFQMLGDLGIPVDIFPEILEPGQVIDNINANVQEEIGLGEIPVIAGATHDTAAAVAAVPAFVDNFAYLSSGTWGLLGVEIPEPLLTEQVYKYNFGNEGGVLNTICLLSNVVNMWFVQECTRVWKLQGIEYSWEQISDMASEAQPFTAFINVDESNFLLPENMPKAIQAYCKRTGQNIPQSHGEILRTIMESLAMKYRNNFDILTTLLGAPPEVFHIVGGASRNSFLNQLTANALGIPVAAGPSEATALGNIIIQMIAMGDVKDIPEARSLLASSFPTKTFEPQDTHQWNENYESYLEKTKIPLQVSGSS